MSDSRTDTFKTDNMLLIENVHGLAHVHFINNGKLGVAVCRESFQNVAAQAEFPVISIESKNAIKLNGQGSHSFAVNPDLIHNIGICARKYGETILEDLSERYSNFFELQGHAEEASCYISFRHPALGDESILLLLPVDAKLIQRALSFQDDDRPVGLYGEKLLTTYRLN